MFDNFTSFDIDNGDVVIHGVTGGQGLPLLLLHGYPQTHVMWHKVAPQLATHFTVVAPDLRGYGQSGKPATSKDHAPYSKRAMAADMVNVMRALGHTHFGVAGHDRGGRVAHRLAADHPDAVSRLAVLDIAPTREMYHNTTDGFARAYWHWFFLIQPAPFPENLINQNSDQYFRHKCGSGSAGLSPFTNAALECYLAAFRNPDTVHASCEDYRAAASIDIQHDDADGEHKITCPVQVLWAKQGVIETHFDPLALWRQRATDVSGEALPGGHFLAEELPNQVSQHLIDFFLHQDTGS
jgi:haloacetate dehalogenase